MARTRTIYRCSECGAAEPKWAGRCAACEAWNSLVEEVERPAAAGRDERLGAGAGTPLPIAEVDMEAWAPAATHLGELDRVLRGGLVPGSVTLLGGEPGIGKSTLLLQALAGLARPGTGASTSRPRSRPSRCGCGPSGWARCRPNLWLVSDTSLPHVLAHLDAVAARRGGHRLHPDASYDPVAVVRPGLGGAGARVRPPPRARGEGAGDGVGARRPRHQGRRPRRPAGARAPRRHGAVVRGRAPPRAAPAAGGEAPLRLHRRARPVRDDRRRPGRRARPVGAVPRRPPPRHARARWWCPPLDGHRPLLVEVQALVGAVARSPRRGARPRASTAAASPLLLAVLAAARPGRPSPTATSTPSSAGGVKTVEPGADLALALALASARYRHSPLPTTWSPAARSASAASCARCTRRHAAWPRPPGSGSAGPSCPPAPPCAVAGIEVIRVATLADAVLVAVPAPARRAVDGRRAS